MISNRFVTRWASDFPEYEFPREFYLQHLEELQLAENSWAFSEQLNALFHWKSGRARLYIPMQHDIPHHLSKFVRGLSGKDLDDFYWLFREISEANEDCLTEPLSLIREKLKGSWSAIIDSAFILHLARPTEWPIIDQHTIRSFIALSAGDVVLKPFIDWKLWEGYVSFFNEAVKSSQVENSIEGRSRVDSALFSWGKSLYTAANRIHNDSFFEPRD